MAGATRKTEKKTIEIRDMRLGEATFCILGTSPLIFNRFGPTQEMALLYPQAAARGRKSETVKHDPWFEFADSMNTSEDADIETGDLPECHIGISGGAVKRALKEAALDQQDAAKTEIGRLTRIDADYLPVYGIPEIFCAMVRQAGITKAPDIRTRAIIPKWATVVKVQYVEPRLSAAKVTKLLSSAGLTIGIGDWRAEKGSRNFGSFRLVSNTDPEFKAILATGGAEAQRPAILTPEAYNSRTAKLLRWFDDEVGRRGDDNKVARINGSGETHDAQQ